MSFRKVTYSKHPSHAARAAHARGERQFRTYDTSAIRPRQSRVPYIVAGAVALIVIIAVIVTFTSSACAEKNPNMVADGTPVTVQVAEGSLVSDIATSLYDAGLVNSTKEFTEVVSAQGAETSLKPGVYEFTGGTSNEDLVAALVAGPSSSSASLTVPEGATIDQIASAVEQAYGGSISADDFKSAANTADAFEDEYSFVADAGNNSLEGFLFPKTYDLLANATASDVISQMLDQYAIEVADLDYSTAQDNGLTEYETLILASIVEKEGTAETYSKVAAVFINRLNNEGDPSYGTLGSDATTAYEVGDSLDSYDWTTDSPYNTRVTKGLPPTPICSPSLEALQAVCSPESDFEDYYFFSFWDDGQGGVEYFFDKTYEEHQQTIADHL